jgi:hypothetical protein
VTQQVIEQISQLASHLQTDQVVECVSKEVR